MAKWRKWWDGYRHYRAASGLAQDILVFFGFKGTLVAALIGGLAYAGARWSHLATVEQFVLALGGFAFVLVIVNGVQHARRVGFGWASSFRGPVLQFGRWHAGTDSGYPPKAYGQTPSWISIGNSKTESPEAARNVTVQIEWINTAGNNRIVVPEAEWYEMGGVPGRRTTTSWTTGATIEGGDEQSFILTLRDVKGQFAVPNHGPTRIDHDRWKARLIVSSDNIAVRISGATERLSAKSVGPMRG